ncbi:MAG: hypothetical protein KTR31_19980 [Myxococcales bacterium]|nr:hypothetical protein [Myxococcales bacterium]
MVTISQPEGSLVNLAIALVDGSDPRMHAPRVARPGEPTGLSRPAMEAVRRVIGRGTARLALGRLGTPWRDAQCLTFGSATLDLLSWLHMAAVRDPNRVPLVLRSTPTTAEQLLLCRAVALLDAAGAEPPAIVARSVWPWLLHGEQLSRAGLEPDVQDIDRLADEAWLLDSLQPQLLSAWIRWCRAARTAELPTTVRHGTAQHSVGMALAQAHAHDPERVAFLGQLAVVVGRLPVAAWVAVRGEHLITTWTRASRARAAVPRLLLDTLGVWGDGWRSTGFVDDGYDEAQRWLSRFDEPLRAMARLRDVVNQAERLREIG